MKSPLGAAQLAVQVFSDPAQTEPVDVVMFAVKLWDTESAAEQLRPVVGQHTVIIPFQNGVESIERLAKIFPREQILGGSAYIATRISAPGVIEHIGTMAGMEFGPLKPAQRGGGGLSRARAPASMPSWRTTSCASSGRNLSSSSA